VMMATVHKEELETREKTKSSMKPNCHHGGDSHKMRAGGETKKPANIGVESV